MGRPGYLLRKKTYVHGSSRVLFALKKRLNVPRHRQLYVQAASFAGGGMKTQHPAKRRYAVADDDKTHALLGLADIEANAIVADGKSKPFSHSFQYNVYLGGAGMAVDIIYLFLYDAVYHELQRRREQGIEAFVVVEAGMDVPVFMAGGQQFFDGRFQAGIVYGGAVERPADFSYLQAGFGQVEQSFVEQGGIALAALAGQLQEQAGRGKQLVDVFVQGMPQFIAFLVVGGYERLKQVGVFGN